MTTEEKNQKLRNSGEYQVAFLNAVDAEIFRDIGAGLGFLGIIIGIVFLASNIGSLIVEIAILVIGLALFCTSLFNYARALNKLNDIKAKVLKC